MKKILFFDTETSGLPKNYKAPAHDVDNWPFICQLAWIVANEKGDILKERNELLQPYRNGAIAYSISEEAERVHRHSLQKLIEQGKKADHVLMSILIDIADADLIVCHNVAFDYPILACEMIRHNIHGELRPKFCTMEASTDICKIPNIHRPNSFKWPQLQELHKHLFGTRFEDAHDALADIRATHKCYFEMKKRYGNTPI